MDFPNTKPVAEDQSECNIQSHPTKMERYRKRCSKCLLDNLLLLLLMLAMVFGAVLGICLRVYVPAFQQPDLHPREMRYLFFPAEIFLRLMTFLALPLLVSSLVSGIGYMDFKLSGKLGLGVLCYYVTTTLIAVTEGFVFTYAIRPGISARQQNQTSTEAVLIRDDAGNRVDMVLDMFRNIFPDNIFTATFQLYRTEVSINEISLYGAGNTTILMEKFQDGQVDAMNILGITFMAIMFSVGLSSIGPKGRPLFAIFDIVFEAVMKIIQVLICTPLEDQASFVAHIPISMQKNSSIEEKVHDQSSVMTRRRMLRRKSETFPIGTVFMIAHTVVQMKDPATLLSSMAIFLVTVLAGLLTHTLITQPLIYFILLRRNPYKHLIGCVKALVTAFATSNSTVTVPVTMDCLKQMGYNKRLVRFMIPIGATVNMDGFALYESLAAIFVATLNGMSPSASQIIILGLTAVAISIGAPTMGGGFVTLILLFKSIGLPLQDIALLVPFDWILGRCRTTVNVWGDCVGVAVVQGLSGIPMEDTDSVEDTAKVDGEGEELHQLV